MLEVDDYILRLNASAEQIAVAVRGLDDEQARWRPDDVSWSMLEVINHLYDEEREDFRARLRSTLDDPTRVWAPIDPAGWVVERRYNERSLEPSLDAYLTERRHSIVWLQQLESPDWNATHHHPAGFAVRAGDLLAAWAAHDLLHLRQLIELQYARLAEAATPFGLRYAGPWSDDEE